jgi:twitching motility two-component system response regulator PilH
MSAKRILVVDDSPTDLYFLSEILRKEGHEVIPAVSGEEAVAKAKSDRPDVVLMDVVMPGMNGFQATRQIARGEETKHIPVIICTSKSQESDKVWGLRQGARDYLVKPIKPADLIEKISALG